MSASLTLPEINGQLFSVHNGEIEDFAIKIIVQKLDPVIATWLQKNLKG